MKQEVKNFFIALFKKMQLNCFKSENNSSQKQLKLKDKKELEDDDSLANFVNFSLSNEYVFNILKATNNTFEEIII